MSRTARPPRSVANERGLARRFKGRTRNVNFAVRPMEVANLADVADIVVANFAVDENPVDRYALPRVREWLAGNFRRDEHAPRFVSTRYR